MPPPQLNEPYSVVTVSCSYCKQKQVVQVLARTGFWSGERQSLTCLNCGKEFEVMLPDTIIGGPFLPQRFDSWNAHNRSGPLEAEIPDLGDEAPTDRYDHAVKRILTRNAH